VWVWEGIGPPTGEPGPANKFFPTKRLYYRQKYSSVSSAVQVVGLQVKKPDVEVRADVVTCGLRL
jgi:hypothetical protein